MAHYILRYGTEEQKRKWLPKMASGEMVAAIAMSEPGAGSDLKSVKTRALKDGDHYVINGSKTFITNGYHANLILVVCKTDPEAGSRGVSIVVVETEGQQASAAAASWRRSARRARTRPSCSSMTCACRARTCSAPKRARAFTS